MPKLLRVTNFAKAGLNTDLMPWDLPPDYLTSITNTLIISGKLSPFGGRKTWTDLPAGFKSGYLMYVRGDISSYWVIAGLDTVYAFDGSTLYDISNTDGYSGINRELLWSGCMLSDIPILNNPGHYPEYWSPQDTSVKLKYLPWDTTAGTTWKDAGESAQIIRSHKQFLFALNLQSGASEFPDGVRWSSPADTNGLPDTWNHLDTTNVAGFVTLGGSGGHIIDGLTLRDAFVVYRENGISVFDYVGGQYVWQIRHLSTNQGLLSKDCLVEAQGRHYFIGAGDIYVNDSNTIQSLLHNKIRKEFASGYDPEFFRNSFVVKDPILKQIWFCVPETGFTHPSVAYVYNWEDGTISKRDLTEAIFSSFGKEDEAPLTWDVMTDVWDASDSFWNQKQISPIGGSVIGLVDASPVQKLVSYNVAPADSEIAFSVTMERTGFALDGMDKVTTITRIYPHSRGPGKLYVQIGSQDYAGSPIRWKPPVLFDPNINRKVDIRTTGELHCFKFFSENSAGNWDLSGIDVEYVEAGTR